MTVSSVVLFPARMGPESRMRPCSCSFMNMPMCLMYSATRPSMIAAISMRREMGACSMIMSRLLPGTRVADGCGGLDVGCG